MRTPASSSSLVVSDSLRSQPLTWSPRARKTRASAETPAPPAPIKWTLIFVRPHAGSRARAWPRRAAPQPPKPPPSPVGARHPARDRKSTRLNSSHTVISYAVFCLKKKTKTNDDGDYLGESTGIVIEFENGTSLYFAVDTFFF